MKTFTSPQLGHRVKHAREALNLSQERLKELLGFKDRQTVSDIENGKRAVKADELVLLTEALNKDVQFFLDPFSVVAEAKYCWRASPDLPGDELNRFEEVAGGWVGLLRWLRAEHKVAARPLKPVLRLSADSSFEGAQAHAEQFVKSYALGLVPAEKLVEFIEQELDIPVLFVDIDVRPDTGAISGAACAVGKLGEPGELGVILINRREPIARRYFDLAHELFHCLTWEAMAPEHRESNAVEHRKGARRIEQLADNFAAALLMPEASLNALIDPTKGTDVRHLVEVASKLCVSAEALSWRLFQLKRINAETQSALAKARGSKDSVPAPKPFSKAFVGMLHTALDKGWLSARKAAKSMGMPLGELTDLFVAHGMPPPFDL